jgi:hypothetical protein
LCCNAQLIDQEICLKCIEISWSETTLPLVGFAKLLVTAKKKPHKPLVASSNLAITIFAQMRHRAWSKQPGPVAFSTQAKT